MDLTQLKQQFPKLFNEAASYVALHPGRESDLVNTDFNGGYVFPMLWVTAHTPFGLKTHRSRSVRGLGEL